MAILRRSASPVDEAKSDAAEAGGMLRSVRRYPAFRPLLWGTIGSNSAFWMYQVAVGWLALELTDSAFFVGLAGFVGGIPVLLFSLPAGVVIDRFDKRLVLGAAQAGVMLVAMLLALLVGADLIQRWSLLVLVFAYGTIMSFIFPTRTAMLPALVQREDLANAVALNSATQNATRVIGPSLAGVLIAATGVWQTFAVAALFQAYALWTTALLPPTALKRGAERGMGIGGLTVGLRIVARDPFLSALITLALAPTVLVMPYINLMPVFARDELGLSATGLGVLMAAIGLGTVAGALGVARSPGLRSIARGQVVTSAVFTLLVALFAVTPWVLVAALLLFAAGWTSAAFLAMNQTALQLHVDDQVRGRVLSIYLMTWGMLPFGQLAVGLAADRAGAPAAMAGFCLLALGCIALISSRFPALRP